MVRKKYVLLAVPAAGVLFGAGVATAAASGGSADGTPAVAPRAGLSSAESPAISNCKPRRSDFISREGFSASTTSTTFSPVPDMTKVVNQGRGGGCLLVQVSGQAFAPGGALEFVGVTVDGAFASPSPVQFAGDSDEDNDGEWAEAHAAVFAIADVPAGNHRVSMVFSSLDGQQVYLGHPAMRIDHR